MSGDLQAVIFDLDGLILDSETPDYLSWKELYARFGLDLTTRDWAAVVGRRDVDLDAPLRERQVDVEAERTSRRRRAALLLEEYLTPAPGVETLLDRLRRADIRRGLASNSDAAYVHQIVDRLHLRGSFGVIVTRGDVARPKPAPDIYHAAFSRLGVRAAQCVALEDSGPGIAAATAAGLKCIAVPTIFTRHHDLAHADLILSSLEAVTLETLSGLL
jgi:HAD superfamily hydrolase (TIGR01509 family)